MSPHISKKRFKDIEDNIREIINSEQEKDAILSNILSVICNVMQYDPNASTYTDEQALRIKAYRQRKKALKQPPPPPENKYYVTRTSTDPNI